MTPPTALGPTGLAMLLGVALCSACRGDDRELDCSAQAEAFAAAYADDGVLLPDIAESTSYPMAMVLSEEGVNRLLTGVVGGNVPFASVLNVGPFSLRFIPQSVPTIAIVPVPNCPRCVLFSVDFDFQIENDDGSPGGAGIGSAEMSIPLRLQQNDDGSSSLVARYDAATILAMPINTMGFDSAEYPGFEGALRYLATQALREQFAVTELLRFQPWTIGGNEVKLAAREFALFTDTRVLSLAMQTNLDLPDGVAIRVGEALPMGVPMALQMHPGLLLGMSRRMVTEGVISRTYDDNGNPDPNGLYGVTLENIGVNPIPNSNKLDVGFRVWRTSEGYCGYADAITALQLGLAPGNQSITVTPTDDLRVTGGEGVGKIAKDNDELIERNKQVVETFKKDLSEQIGITINYNDIGVEGSRILFSTDALIVEDDKIDIIIDFTVVADEDPDDENASDGP